MRLPNVLIITPSRCSLLTGCYPQSLGVMSLVGGSWNWSLTHPRMHLSHVLHDEGYHTRMYGYQDKAVRPEDLGFDDSSSYLGPRQPKQVMNAVEMAEDPAHRAVLDELNTRFYEWLEATGDPIRFGPTPTPYYNEAISDYSRYKELSS